MRLTILFDAPYWIAVLEVERENILYAARYIFGAEPSDQEVYEFVQRDLLALQTRMTAGVAVTEAQYRHVNPKRVQREIRRQLAQPAISTKAQDAMRLQIEQNKHNAVQKSRLERKAQRDRKRELSREKAKAQHRGH
jgi:hypothetical protein